MHKRITQPNIMRFSSTGPRTILTTVAIAALSAACTSAPSDYSWNGHTISAAAIADIRAGALADSNGPSPALRAYARYYGLDSTDAIMRGTYAHSNTGRVFTLSLEPSSARATVVLVHGYLKHSGLCAAPAIRFLSAGFRVVLMDLPGHGLSDGPRGDVADFSDYSNALRAVLDSVSDGRPLFVASHSTGAATTLDLVLRGIANDVKAIALFAPLVRNYFWHVSRFGNALAGWALTSLPRLERADFESGDSVTDPNPESLHELEYRNDPLGIYHVPIGWVRALGVWNDRITHVAALLHTPTMLIVQGSLDTVVDASYNVPFIKRLAPTTHVVQLPGARHDLWQESHRYRSAGLDAAVALFEKLSCAPLP